MGSKVYCIAILGRTPAILTELMWWLVENENADVVGLEVWTTVSYDGSPTGYSQLSHALEQGLWRKLCEALGDQRYRVPSLPEDLDPIRAEDAPIPTDFSAEPRPFMVIGFQRKRGFIGDVRNDDDAVAIAAALHGRVRELRQNLPADVELIGSLAGGRKTMSTALESAFQLQARIGDRLVHVLTHPKIEDPASGVLADFVVPNQAIAEKLGVEIEDQVTVYTPPFVMIRELLLRAELRGRELQKAFDELDYDRLLGTLHRTVLSGEEPSARIDNGDGRGPPWRYNMFSGRNLRHCIPLNEADAETLSVILSFGPAGADWRRAYEALASRTEYRGPRANTPLDPWDFDPEKAAAFIRKRLNRLKKRLGRLPSLGFDEFMLIQPEPRSQTYLVPAADRVGGWQELMRL